MRNWEATEHTRTRVTTCSGPVHFGAVSESNVRFSFIARGLRSLGRKAAGSTFPVLNLASFVGKLVENMGQLLPMGWQGWRKWRSNVPQGCFAWSRSNWYGLSILDADLQQTSSKNPPHACQEENLSSSRITAANGKWELFPCLAVRVLPLIPIPRYFSVNRKLRADGTSSPAAGYQASP
jgi:hypothetical protein